MTREDQAIQTMLDGAGAAGDVVTVVACRFALTGGQDVSRLDAYELHRYEQLNFDNSQERAHAWCLAQIADWESK